MTTPVSDLKEGDLIYFLDLNTGKWLSGVIEAAFSDSYGLDSGLVRKDMAITEAEAKRRGVHQSSTPADRARYVESLYANFQPQKSGDEIVDAIVAEHNRIRRSPADYAAELMANRQALIDSRTKNIGNPDSIDLATKAIDTAIQDLMALEALPPLQYSPAVSISAKQAAEQATGHSAIREMITNWKAAGFGDGAPAESISSLPGAGSNAEKAKAVVQGLLIDWGANNAGVYGHRRNIIDKRLVSVQQSQITNYTQITVGIAQTGTVYIQYYADPRAAAAGAIPSAPS